MDSWFEEKAGVWMCCLGDMDGSISVLSLDRSQAGKEPTWNLIWKSASYGAGDEYDGGAVES
jgi:hypothetical protein